MTTPVTVTRYVGNCQICEGDFKATSGGAVALHGYQRPGYGHIHGRCPGEGALAYERSRDLILVAIKSKEREVAALDAELGRIDRGELASIRRSIRRPPYFVEVKADEVAPYEWQAELQRHRGEVGHKRSMAERARARFQQRYDAWALRPLREVDELGRTEEDRAKTEARKGARASARQANEDKAKVLAAGRGAKLIERRAVLDGAGELIRQAAARGDRDGALKVLRELGRKRHASLLDPSFAVAEPIAALKLQGVIPADLPDVGERVAYEWEEDLHADAALLELGLARQEPGRGRGIAYRNYELWR
jgi:hypothetical protein